MSRDRSAVFDDLDDVVYPDLHPSMADLNLNQDPIPDPNPGDGREGEVGVDNVNADAMNVDEVDLPKTKPTWTKIPTYEPKYNGKGPVDDWLMEFEMWVSGVDYDPSKWALSCYFSTEGKAKNWLNSHVKTNKARVQAMSWDEMSKLMMTGPFNASESEHNVRLQLSKFKFTGGIWHSFVSDFNSWAAKSSTLDEASKCYFFMEALPSTLAGKMYVDGNNQPWTSLRDLQQFATETWNRQGKDLLGDKANSKPDPKPFLGTNNKPNTPTRKRGFNPKKNPSKGKGYGRNGGKGNGGDKGEDLGPKCYNCKERGHIQRDCPNPPRAKKAKTNK